MGNARARRSGFIPLNPKKQGNEKNESAVNFKRKKK
jgi:hypothetical protein